MERVIPTAFALVLLLFGACDGGPSLDPRSEEQAAGTDHSSRPLRAVIDEDLPTLDPHHHLTIVGGLVLRNIFEPLVDLGREGELVPRLAKSWETADSQSWQFFLREDVFFHDGTALTTADVVFSLERGRDDPRSEIGGFLAGVESISHDPQAGRIDIETTRPDPYFLESLASVLVVSENVPEVIRQPIGTGPYRFGSYEQGNKLTLESFPEYWRGSPREPSVEFLVIPEAEAAVQRLERGEVDLVRGLPPHLVERVESKPELWVDSRLSQSVLFLELNPGVPPLDDPKVRKAIDLALDREALMSGVHLNHARPASQLLGPGVFGYDPDLEATRRDLEMAEHLLRQSSYGEGAELLLETTEAYLPQAIEIGKQLDEAGFKTRAVARPWPELYAGLESGTIGAWYGLWNFDSSDAAIFFDQVIHSPTVDGTWGSANFSGHGDPGVDLLIRAASAELDPEARRRQFQQISRRVAEIRIYVPILWPLDLYGMRRDLEWEARKDSGLLFFDMHRKE